MTKGSEDYSKGKALPSPVTPATTVCFKIIIPNAVQYRAALFGVLSQLSQWYTWDHPTDGTTCFDCEEAAQLWAKAISEAYFEEDCEGEVSCADVADCIENDPAVQAAIGAIVPAVPIDGMTYPPGVPLTPSQMTTPLNEIDECAFDPFWAQCEQYINYMVDLGQDVLEQIAAYSAALDAGEAVPMGQFLGKLKNSSTAGKVIEFLQWALTVVKAQYEAADNTANRNTLKCAIFCENRDSCQITIEGTLNTLNERLGGLLAPGDLTDLPTMVTAFTTAAFDPSLALDLWLLFLMGSAKTAGMFGLAGIDETINLVLAVAVNDANNDWEALCDDCDDTPVDPACVDFTLNDGGWLANSGLAQYYPGAGWGTYFTSGQNYLWIRRPTYPAGKVYQKLRIQANQTIASLAVGLPGGTVTLTTGGPIWEISELTHPANFPIIENIHGVTLAPTGLIASSNTVKFTMVCLYETL